MKIGVWLGLDVIKTEGGGASYQNRLIKLIDSYQFDDNVELCFLSFVPQDGLSKEVIVLRQFPSFVYRLAERWPFLRESLKRLDRRIVRKKGLSRVLEGTEVKVVYYLFQTVCFDPNFPFVATNWDIGYMSTHAFPELTSPGFYEIRDDFYKRILPKALMIICESETGKEEIVKYTNIGEHKIRVMPMFAGEVSSLKVSDEQMDQMLQAEGLSRNHYFYYPAQFWAHKNHVGLLRAFSEFKKKHGGDYKLVLSGSNKGNVDYIRNLIRECNLEKDVVLLGFVSEEMVYTLYKNATCLIMASHFGPTNMPPIESMELGCPVICSDLGGHREILGDNAIYFNSYDSHSICMAIIKLVENREEYLERIERQKHETIFSANHAMIRMNEIMQEVVNIRSNWG